MTAARRLASLLLLVAGMGTFATLDYWTAAAPAAALSVAAAAIAARP